MNYFPADNPKNLDFLEIGKGKNKQSSQSQKSLGSNQQINILDILKNLSQQSNNLKNWIICYWSYNIFIHKIFNNLIILFLQI